MKEQLPEHGVVERFVRKEAGIAAEHQILLRNLDLFLK